MRKLVHITTVAHSLGFLRGQPDFMAQRGFQIAAITSPGEHVAPMAEELQIPIHTVEMPRSITPLQDLKAVARMTRLLRNLSPDIVHSHTPKGGLLGVISATLADVPVRFYHMRGLPFETMGGVKKNLLRMTETVSCTMAHQVVAVGNSIRTTAVNAGIVPPEKIKVLADGSGQGVDAQGRFNPRRFDQQHADSVRNQLGLPEGATVVGFIGRLVRDKGIIELAEAFRRVQQEFESAHLLVIGPFEKRDPVPDRIRRLLKENPRVHLAGFREDVDRLYPVMDLVVLPTHREGFPNTPLEAAAMELPVVVSDIGPCKEAVVPGETGLCFSVGDVDALAETLATYLGDPQLREDHGRAGRERVLDKFLPQRIWEELARLYEEHL